MELGLAMSAEGAGEGEAEGRNGAPTLEGGKKSTGYLQNRPEVKKKAGVGSGRVFRRIIPPGRRLSGGSVISGGYRERFWRRR